MVQNNERRENERRTAKEISPLKRNYMIVEVFIGVFTAQICTWIIERYFKQRILSFFEKIENKYTKAKEEIKRVL
jgi:hypothetical protein